MRLAPVFSCLKYSVALMLLWLVLQQVGLQTLTTAIVKSEPLYLLQALLCYSLSQYYSISRMNAYYRWHGRPLEWGYSWRLHYVALFYNLILPSGIGGDGYKVYALKQRYDYPLGEGVRIQVLSRASGMLILCWSLYVLIPCWYGGSAAFSIEVVSLIMAIFIVTTIGYFRLFVPLIHGSRRNEWRALSYSFGVQATSLMTMSLLWLSLGAEGDLIAYLILFQCAAIAGLVPISIGGLGLREFTFFYGASLMIMLQPGTQVAAETGVAISLLMFAIVAISALIGSLWLPSISKQNAKP